MDTLLSCAQCMGTIVHAIFNMYLKLNPFVPPKKTPKSGFQDIAGSLFLLESLDENPEAPIGDHQGKRATRGSFFGWDGTSENPTKRTCKIFKGEPTLFHKYPRLAVKRHEFFETQKETRIWTIMILFFDHNFLLGWTCECTFLMINIYCIRLEYMIFPRAPMLNY